ncbi:hypothetical protein [Streptomyces kebangsaanensis]|uniref:hypothetical protein n=1 Tax=Streptomyces kebangsaanensis TaxID=864058 RepID=UPI000A7409D8|nr:hypothetical protein [Streptomyces kebangsaanensis]
MGAGLRSTQDAARKRGFHFLKPHDAPGRDRTQTLDRNRKVRGQDITAGRTAPTNTTLDFGAVKPAGTCPPEDEKPPSPTGAKMPDFKGESVKSPHAALDSRTSATVNDASSAHHWVPIGRNWQFAPKPPPLTPL